MTNPWDIPPFPTAGDADEWETYKWVGKCLTEWEWLEYTLGHLYSEFIGRRAEIDAIKEYGEPRIFADRISCLAKSAGRFFIRHQNQSIEGKFYDLLKAIIGFSDRRNEIAHGIVTKIDFRLSSQDSSMKIAGYVLIPTLYTKRKLDVRNLPKYIYTANELTVLAARFGGLARATVRLRILSARGRQP